MKKVLKILAIILLVLVLVVAAIMIYVKTALPNVGEASELKIEITPERLARGKYLANHVALCTDCHSTRDWTKFAGPTVPGTSGAGGEIFDQIMGFPGSYHARNITPFGLEDWTDGEIFRAITSGVSKDGVALFPIMPYLNYGKMNKEDVYSIMAYIRSLPSVPSEIPASISNFPMNFIINTIPQKPNFQKMPTQSDQTAYGEYLFNIAACAECHTPKDERGQSIAGLELAGGFAFPIPTGGIVRTSNLTPHETGLKNWTSEQFVTRFNMYTDSTYQNPKIEDGEFNTPMPWLKYAEMNTTDLEAIFAFLQTVAAIENRVERFTP